MCYMYDDNHNGDDIESDGDDVDDITIATTTQIAITKTSTIIS